MTCSQAGSPKPGILSTPTFPLQDRDPLFFVLKGYPQMLSLLTRLFTRAVQVLDRSVGWYRVLLPIALIMLIGLRIILRQRNLSSTYTVKSPSPAVPPTEGGSRHYLAARTADGTYNDLDIPAM